MSTLYMNRINRAYINRLKIKGASWLLEEIEKEKTSEFKDEQTDIYIQALEKALAELELSE